mmetsp:Transcript_47557/g.110129  ORF Transcript_47557/g.110129 Transcript_47557/m.110129 type:complete len:229 (-) Transcript_47557:115-801(-)
MLGVDLLLPAFTQLFSKVVPQPFQQSHNAAGLELVRIGLWRIVGQVIRILLGAFLADHTKECRQDGLGLLRQLCVLRKLQQRLLALSTIECLLLQHGDRTLKRIDTLRVVLGFRVKYLTVLGALGHLLPLRCLVLAGLGLKLCQFLAKGLNVTLKFPNAGGERLHLFSILLDLGFQASGLLGAPRVELGKGHLLIAFLLLCFHCHVLKQLNHLLDSRRGKTPLRAALC